MQGSFQSSVCIPGAILVMFFSVSAVVLNSLLLIVIWKDPTKSLRSTTAVYIGSLSTFYVFYGLIAGTIAAESYIACALGDNVSPHLERNFSRLCLAFFIRAENFLILAFAVERIGNTAFPVLNPRGKAKNALLCVACIVFYSFCFSIFDILGGKFWVRRLDVHLNNIVPLIVTVVLSALLRNVLRKLNIPQTDSNGVDGVSQVRTAEEIRTSRLKKQIPLANAFISVALLFVASVIAYFVLSVCEVYCSGCLKQEWFFAALRCSIAIHFLHIAVSPLIYFTCLPKFREGFKMVFCDKNQEEEVEMADFSRNNNKLGTVPPIYL